MLPYSRFRVGANEFDMYRGIVSILLKKITLINSNEFS